MSMKIILYFLILTSSWCAFSQSLNVTNCGAKGDAIVTTANVSIGSAFVTIPSASLTAADIGKVIELFGAGPSTGTTNQDIAATITGVSSGTVAVIDRNASASAAGIRCIYGTLNNDAFQACINTSSNSVIAIPAGTYMLISTQALDPNFVMSGEFESHQAVTLQKGGVHFLGDNRDASILMGCGAWQNKGAFAYRGYMFACNGPVTNDAPVIFESLTFDGGVVTGNTSLHGFPASTASGSGWDVTHDAFIDVGTPPLHASKTFNNCQFVRWRGEVLKGTVANTDGFILVTNSVFSDNNASCVNFSFSHDINSCTFSNIFEVEEFYEGYNSNACFFRNSFVTNATGGGIAINGALTNHPPPTYTISSNVISAADNSIMTTPAENVIITGNKFFDAATAIALGVAGYQGSAANSNIVVSLNTFNNCSFPIQVEGSGINAVFNVTVSNNAGTTGNTFAYGYGWSTNASFVGNTVSGFSGGLNSTLLQGQYYLDDPSNVFPPHQVFDASGISNAISYAYGERFTLVPLAATALFYLDDSLPLKIPPGAVASITNNGTFPAKIYFSSATPTTFTNLPVGDSILVNWINNAWNGWVGLPDPPTNLHTTSPNTPTSVGLAMTYSFAANPTVTNIVIEVGNSPGLYTSSVNIGLNTAIIITGLQKNHTYYFAAKAQSPSGDSALSNEVRYSTSKRLSVGTIKNANAFVK